MDCLSQVEEAIPVAELEEDDEDDEEEEEKPKAKAKKAAPKKNAPKTAAAKEAQKEGGKKGGAKGGPKGGAKTGTHGALHLCVSYKRVVMPCAAFEVACRLPLADLLQASQGVLVSFWQASELARLSAAKHLRLQSAMLSNVGGCS